MITVDITYCEMRRKSFYCISCMKVTNHRFMVYTKLRQDSGYRCDGCYRFNERKIPF